MSKGDRATDDSKRYIGTETETGAILNRSQAFPRSSVLVLVAFTSFLFLIPALALPTSPGNLVQGYSDNMLVETHERAREVPDFELSANPAEVTVAQGSLGILTISISGLNRFSGTVQLSVAPSLGLFVSLNPPQVFLSPGQSPTFTMTVFPPVTLPLGTYTVNVTGASSSRSHTITVKVMVKVAPRPDFVLSVRPENLHVEAGGSTTATLTIAFQNGSTGRVDLTVEAPDSFTVKLDPGSLEGSGVSVLTVTVASTVVPGPYVLKVNAAQGSLTHSGMIVLMVTAPGASQAAPLLGGQAVFLYGGATALMIGVVWTMFVVLRRWERSQTKYRYGAPAAMR